MSTLEACRADAWRRYAKRKRAAQIESAMDGIRAGPR